MRSWKRRSVGSLAAAVWLVIGGPGQADNPTVAWPADPAPPVVTANCADLHVAYRAVIDGLKAQAEACDASASDYARARYGRVTGTGECRRRVVGHCKPIVHQCAHAAEAMAAALDRCRAAIGG